MFWTSVFKIWNMRVFVLFCVEYATSNTICHLPAGLHVDDKRKTPPLSQYKKYKIKLKKKKVHDSPVTFITCKLEEISSSRRTPTFHTGEHNQRLLVIRQCCTKSFINIYSQHLFLKSFHVYIFRSQRLGFFLRNKGESTDVERKPPTGWPFTISYRNQPRWADDINNKLYFVWELKRE